MPRERDSLGSRKKRLGEAYATQDLLAGLARPAAGRPATRHRAAGRVRTLIFVPQANLTSLDPVWTTATVTRNFAYLVYDTLYGIDADLQPQPQMAAGHTIDDDGRRWTITLRPGPRLPRRHAGARRGLRGLDPALDEAGFAGPDRSPPGWTRSRRRPTTRWCSGSSARSPPLAWALGKSQPSPPVIMPERLADTDPFKALSEVVGSGPFRFVPDEYVSGSRAVFASFDGYVPRDEPPSGTAGGKRPAGGPGGVAGDPRGRHRRRRAASRRGGLGGAAADRPAAAAARGPHADGGPAGPVRPVSGAAVQLPAGPDRQPGRAPGDPGRDRPGRGDAGGDGRRQQRLPRAGRLLPAGHAVGQRRGHGPAGRQAPVADIKRMLDAASYDGGPSCCCTRPTSRSTTRWRR